MIFLLRAEGQPENNAKLLSRVGLKLHKNLAK